MGHRKKKNVTEALCMELMSSEEEANRYKSFYVYAHTSIYTQNKCHFDKISMILRTCHMLYDVHAIKSALY